MIANHKLNDNLKIISNLLKHFEVNQELTNEEIPAKSLRKVLSFQYLQRMLTTRLTKVKSMKFCVIIIIL